MIKSSKSQFLEVHVLLHYSSSSLQEARLTQVFSIFFIVTSLDTSCFYFSPLVLLHLQPHYKRQVLWVCISYTSCTNTKCFFVLTIELMELHFRIGCTVAVGQSTMALDQSPRQLPEGSD